MIGFLGINVEDSFQQSVAVTTPVTLEVNTGNGDIQVHSGSKNEVRILAHVTVDAAKEQEAEHTLKRILDEPPIEVTDNVVRVGDLRKYELDKRPSLSICIDYEIIVPFHTNVLSHSGSGDQEIRGVEGRVKANAGSGDVVVEGIASDAVVHVGSGDNSMSEIGGNITLNVGCGDVSIEQVEGDVDVNVGSGDVQLDRASSHIVVHAGSGDLGIRSGIEEDSHWRLTTQSGDIVVCLPEAAEFLFELKTHSGDIEVDHPATFSAKQERYWTGQVGEAPHSILFFSTSSGDIQIQTANS